MSDQNPCPTSTLISQRFIFESPQKYLGPPFKIAANKYTHASCQKNGVTLLFAHANGAHKEQWEPMLEELFCMQSAAPRTPNHSSIREVWAIDAPTYGDSALLNASTHAERMDNMSISEFGISVATVVKSRRFSGHRLVLIGHSLGATACMYSTKLFTTASQIPYTAIILIESVFLDRDIYYAHLKDREDQLSFLTRAVARQRDSWESREAAYEWLIKRKPWSQWDVRVLKKYVEHGLRDCGDGNIEKVQTKCSKQQEASIYRDIQPPFDAADQVAVVCAKGIPIHVMFGSINDLAPRYSQDSVTDPSKGRNVASITRILDARHMIVQENPRAVAEYIARVLSHHTAKIAKL